MLPAALPLPLELILLLTFLPLAALLYLALCSLTGRPLRALPRTLVPATSQCLQGLVGALAEVILDPSLGAMLSFTLPSPGGTPAVSTTRPASSTDRPATTGTHPVSSGFHPATSGTRPAYSGSQNLEGSLTFLT